MGIFWTTGVPATLKGQKRGAWGPLNPLVVSSHVVLGSLHPVLINPRATLQPIF